MNTDIPNGLKYVMVLGAVASFITSVPSLLIPAVVVQLSGLDPKAIPAIQQAGALTFGYCIAWLFCLRATRWEQVKITVASAAVVFALSAIGAFYYIAFQGVVSLGLVVILAVSILMTVLCAYYYLTLAGITAPAIKTTSPMTGPKGGR